jgi:hypothetical protein
MCFALFCGDFCMDLSSADSDEAMKRGDETSNASSLQFLSSINRFIATNFFSALNAPLLLFAEKHHLTLHHRYFKKNSSLNASAPLLFKLTLPTSAHSIVPSHLMGMVAEGNGSGKP